MTVLKCDHCGEIDSVYKRVRKYMYPDGEELNYSGNGYKAIWKYTELCFGCVTLFIKTNPEIDIREYL
jgi:hypothetical protein